MDRHGKFERRLWVLAVFLAGLAYASYSLDEVVASWLGVDLQTSQIFLRLVVAFVSIFCAFALYGNLKLVLTFIPLGLVVILIPLANYWSWGLGGAEFAKSPFGSTDFRAWYGQLTYQIPCLLVLAGLGWVLNKILKIVD
ncbi:MAG: hypothetical protein NVS3B3_04530 [Aquirhabdus sp.]